MPPQLLDRPTTDPAIDDRSIDDRLIDDRPKTGPADLSTADTATRLLMQRVRFAERRAAVRARPVPHPARHRLLGAVARQVVEIARHPSRLLAGLVGLLLLSVLLLPRPVAEVPTPRAAGAAGIVTSRASAPPLPAPGFTVYEGSAAEPIRFVVNGPMNVLAAIPGGLLQDWQEARGEALARMTFGDRPVEPEVDRLSPTGDSIESIRYRSVWPGVDLVVRSTLFGIFYEFELQPGVDPATIVLAYPDGVSLSIGADGRLHAESAAGAWTSGALESWQDGPNGREPVSTEFVLLGGGRFGYRVGPYDVTRPLIIDPPVE